MGFSKNRILWMFMVLMLCVFTLCLDLCCGEGHVHTHHCNHGHGDHHEEFKQQSPYVEKAGREPSHYVEKEMDFGSKLPEELAEEEDLKLYGFGIDHGHHHQHDHDHGSSDLSGVGLWINAMGCSLLVSLASLICLILLPVIFIQGKPSKAVVDSLALFGAGAMLGDAFLHQLPHAFGGGHSHSHDHTGDNNHHQDHDHGHSHAHSLKDLSVGLCVLAGIVVFLLVEKIVRYIEHNSGGHDVWGHGHHHHHNTAKNKLKKDDDVQNETESETSEEKVDDPVDGGKLIQSKSVLRKRTTTSAATDDKKTDLNIPNGSTNPKNSLTEKDPAQSPSNLVFGYLNLFSDGVHNFTDGMALGSAFLLYGSVGGWSRTLFLLAHELPQEVGDFGILVRSGFSVFKALFFNFLSALAALAGTALALLWGQDPGQSSLIEGFTAGGFIYIAVAGVLAEMNSSGSPSVKSTVIQLTSLVSGMAIALCISLIE